MEKKINEIRVEMDPTTFAKERGHLKPTDTVKLVPKTTTSTTPSASVSTSSMSVTEDDVIEPEAVIEPQDKATIKYLSNVEDSNTGEISKPFTIGDKKYQMVRGIKPDKEVVMGVYCFDDINESGDNIIHPVDYFEENIAKKAMREEEFDYAAGEREYYDKQYLAQDKELEPKVAPIKQKIEPKKSNTEPNKDINLSEYKYFIVNEKTGKFKKFKKVSEVASAIMNEGEKFMSLQELKRYFEQKIFGKPSSKVLTKNELMESIKPKNVIKTIKIKDIK